MKRLGISVYVDQAPIESILEYLQKASAHGFTRIFTCLISLEGENFNAFKDLCRHAHALNMTVIADVDPNVFKNFNLEPSDLKFFHDLGLSGIRLDLGFSGHEEALMSQNPYGLKIELNMSNGTKYVDNVISYGANRTNIIGCHNFYPHRYTGLSREHFTRTSMQFRDYGLRTAAFVSSPNAKYGPWPVQEGLCTLEEHRSLSITTQVKDMFHSQWIDDVIIANMFALDEELEALGRLNKEVLELKVSLEKTITEIERKIILEEPHFNRGDVSEYLIRSTQSRVKYKGMGFPPHNTVAIKKGHVLIESDLYTRYAGELQLALKTMVNSGKTNVVATVDQEEQYLIDFIQPWQSFRFVL